MTRVGVTGAAGFIGSHVCDRLLERGYEVVGSDISSEMMQVAREQLGPMERLHGYVRADAEAMPFPAKSVDCVMSIRFLFHVDPQTRRPAHKLLRELRRRHLARYQALCVERHKPPKTTPICVVTAPVPVICAARGKESSDLARNGPQR